MPSPRVLRSAGTDNSNKENGHLGGNRNKAMKRKAVSMGGANLRQELSPRRLARRSLVPRKSIMRAPASFDDGTQEFTRTTTFPPTHTQEPTATFGETMDFTQFGQNSRRVSFAAGAQVRMFADPVDIRDTSDMSMTTAYEASSSTSHEPEDSIAGRRASGSHKRRSSVQSIADFAPPSSHRARFSVASDGGEASMSMDEDMSLDEGSVAGAFAGDQAFFFPQQRAGGRAEEEEDSGDDMEMTNVHSAIAGDVSQADDSVDDHETDPDASQTMDFTVPLGEPLPRIDQYGNALPSKQDELSDAWSALENTTQNRTVSLDGEEDMALGDAMQRLLHAQRETGLEIPTVDGEGDVDSDSDSDSGLPPGDEYDQTMDFTSVTSGLRSRAPSLGFGLTIAPVSPERGAGIVRETTPHPVSPRSPLRPTAGISDIFAPPPPPPETPATRLKPPAPTKSRPLTASTSSIPVPISKARGTTPQKPRATFTAAFAPPSTSPKKRRLSASDGSDSPRKRQALDAPKSPSKAGPAGPRALAFAPATENIFAPATTTNADPAITTSAAKPKPARRPSSFALRRQSSVRTADAFSAPPPVVTFTEPEPEPEPEPAPEPEVQPEPVTEGSKGKDSSLLEVNQSTTRRNNDPSPLRKSMSSLQLDQAVIIEEDEEEYEMELDDDEIEERNWIIENLPKVSISDFLQMTGITFLDSFKITRRSTIGGPGVLGLAQDYSGERREYTLTDYVNAMAVCIPQLESYNWGCRQLKKHIAEFQATSKAYEEEVDACNPPLFMDYLASDEESREGVEQLLKLIKAHSRLSTKAGWYAWRHQIISDVQDGANEHLQKLEESKVQLTQFTSAFPKHLPSLREQHARIKAELEAERASIAQVTACDPEVIAGLVADIEEQNGLIERYQDDVNNSALQLEKQNTQRKELEDERKASVDAISASKAQCDLSQGRSRDDVFRLQAELEVLKRFHSWDVKKLSTDRVILVFDQFITVNLRCQDYEAVRGRAELSLMADCRGKRTQLPLLNGRMLDTARRHLASPHCGTKISTIMQDLTNLFTSFDRVRAELRLMRIKFPLSLSNVEDHLHATATILLVPTKTKFSITFPLNEQALCGWPNLVSTIQPIVRVVYGTAERDDILFATQDRLASATPETNYGVLLDACADAQALYQ